VSDKEFAVPQEDVDRVRGAAGAASKIILFLIIAGVLAALAFAGYWTQIANKDLPVTVDVSVEESQQ